ncbi:MAG: peptidylprolyl isomerase [Alphaproteobacteria bacterium]|nr:MAG: peptidylprolyl isomerase [Alphaproteobacteria bacterium]
MVSLAPGIEVNGIRISPDDIRTEVQYHPAESLFSAKYEAMRALVIRELLLQRASELGISGREEAVMNPDPVIDELLAKEIKVPCADKKTCKRYYNNNKGRFFTSPLFEASHILYLAPPGDEETRSNAFLKAQFALERLRPSPSQFETIAREESACSSAAQGGRLGQISRSQTMPAFEAALFGMKAGEISADPVRTEVGYHIIKVHARAEGQQLPFENVAEWIAKDLHEKSWRKAFQQYVQILAGRAKISGFRLEGSTSPLVQ